MRNNSELYAEESKQEELLRRNRRKPKPCKHYCHQLAKKVFETIEFMLFFNLILFVFLFGFMEFVISGRYGAQKEANQSKSVPGESL